MKVVERLETEKESISAKSVRALIEQQNEEGLKALIPDSTMEYLKRKGFLGEVS